MRSENAGTSNRKTGENPVRRNTEVSGAMVISSGLVGPKPIPNGGGDGQQVNIPALPCVSNGGTHRSTDRVSWNETLGTQGCLVGKSARHKPRGKRKSCESRTRIGTAVPRKTSRAKHEETVPETDTGGWA